jgi:uncharacterized protein YdhG (YjbR/CyaY superfamily)
MVAIFKNTDEYIKSFPDNVQDIMIQIRNIIKEEAPDAVESISYGMVVFKTCGKPLVYFAGYRKHIGFYALPTGHAEFSKALSNYKKGKGSVQFPLDKPIPFDLIRDIVKFRVKENREQKKV